MRLRLPFVAITFVLMTVAGTLAWASNDTDSGACSGDLLKSGSWHPVASSNVARIVIGGPTHTPAVARILWRNVRGVWLEKMNLETGEVLEKALYRPGLIRHAWGQAERMTVQELQVGQLLYRVEDHYRLSEATPGLWIWYRSVLLRRDTTRSVLQN